MFKISRLGVVALLLAAVFAASGCAVGFYKRSPNDMRKIEDLKAEVERLKLLRDQENRELDAARAELERRLKGEQGVSVEMSERGLVVTFLAEVLFDSGKAKVKTPAHEVLDKVAKVITEKAPDRNIAVEGHTDNEPIKKSGWKSNWELSTARATSVLHYLEEKGIAPEKLQATGYGEYRPVASNDTIEGRQENRRVEIIILPRMSKAESEFLKEHEKESEYTK
ncbi:MAG: OmpA family protein [Candidatus Omnitrophica bacterium]|nr:OmpA family protein [Candidatus Omnitrophota bacterium]MDD5310791.1 OmpA family protein [Candidatus Omnitrophota bacterium]MDD5546824.1 OmpA family protein [Candidatus Omnitrophota bacterium]